MPALQLQVAQGEGPSNNGSGSLLNLRGGGQGDLIASEYNPRYYEVNYRKKMFQARSALRATSLVGVAMVGLQLWNSSNNVNLVITKLGTNIVVTSATQTGVVLAAGTGQVAAPTSQTAIDRQQANVIGNALGVGLAYAAGTFTNAPVAFMDVLHNTAAIGTTGVDAVQWDLEGSIIVPPQAYIAFAAVGAAGAAASNNHWIQWIEQPI